MKLDQAFSGVQRVFFDTSPVVYYVERNSEFFPIVRLIFKQLKSGTFQAVTSPVTLAECLVVPIRKQMTQLQQDFVNVVTSGQNTSFFLIDATVGQTAADLRARYTLKLPDALQIATAIASNCDAFLTNDEQLKRVQELNIIVIKDLEV